MSRIVFLVITLTHEKCNTDENHAVTNPRANGGWSHRPHLIQCTPVKIVLVIQYFRLGMGLLVIDSGANYNKTFI